jgi:hypothetical protein
MSDYDLAIKRVVRAERRADILIAFVVLALAMLALWLSH